jgi:hypothetical protein
MHGEGEFNRLTPENSAEIETIDKRSPGVTLASVVAIAGYYRPARSLDRIDFKPAAPVRPVPDFTQ